MRVFELSKATRTQKNIGHNKTRGPSVPKAASQMPNRAVIRQRCLGCLQSAHNQRRADPAE